MILHVLFALLSLVGYATAQALQGDHLAFTTLCIIGGILVLSILFLTFFMFRTRYRRRQAQSRDVLARKIVVFPITDGPCTSTATTTTTTPTQGSSSSSSKSTNSDSSIKEQPLASQSAPTNSPTYTSLPDTPLAQGSTSEKGPSCSDCPSAISSSSPLDSHPGFSERDSPAIGMAI